MTSKRLPNWMHDYELLEAPADTDSLIWPVVAGVVPHLLLSAPREDWVPSNDDVLEEVRADAERLLRDAEPGNDAAWESDVELYDRTRKLAMLGWMMVPFWMSPMYAAWKFPRPAAERDERNGGLSDAAALVHWFRRNASEPLVDIALTAILAIHAVTTEEDTIPAIAQRARPIRVEVADILRRRGLVRWPVIIRTISSEWLDGGAARLALELATVTMDIGGRIERMSHELEARFEKLEQAKAAQARADARAERGMATPTVPRTRYEQLRRGEEERYRALESRFADVSAERDLLASREGRLRSRIESLTEKLAAAQQSLEVIADTIATSGSGEEEDEPVVPTVVVPDVPKDALAARSVLLFTARESGTARDAMRDALLDYGAADVTVYMSDRERGPATVPADALVVLDVRFMAHSDYYALVRLAEKSGAWYCAAERGASLIGREVARRFQERA